MVDEERMEDETIDDQINDKVISKNNNRKAKKQKVDQSPSPKKNDKSSPSKDDTESKSGASSESQVTTSKDRVDPLIYFKIESKFIENSKFLLTKEIESYKKSLKIDLKDVKITANGNLMIYFISNVDKNKLYSSNFLKTHKKLDLSSTDRRPQAILKGVSASVAEEFDSLLEEHGIIEVNPINPDKPEAKVCKVIFESEEKKKAALLKRIIKIDYFTRFYLEEFRKPPKQCHKCNKFGHIKDDCPNIEVCKNCSTSHTGECKKIDAKCANCNGQHSSYYRGCPVFKEKRIQQESNSNNSKFTRFYSESDQYSGKVKSNEFNSLKSELLKIQTSISTIEKQVNENNQLIHSLLQLPAKVETIENKLEDLKSKLNNTVLENNLKLMHFMIEMMKIFNPDMTYFEGQATLIKNAMIHHKLGDIDQGKLEKYLKKALQAQSPKKPNKSK
jgi:hypothetical protein